jgi:hypothetical protein
MALTERIRGHVCLALLVAAPVAADVSQELADLAVRVDYGFYAQEPSIIAAARTALERLPEADPAVRYQRAFAALRAAQLAPTARAAGALLDECTRLATPDEQQTEDAERWILAAACGAVAVERGLAQQRRRDQALARAIDADPANPRIALLEAWMLDSQRAAGAPAARDAAAAKLALAIERFRARQSEYDAPSWGEAEALARLGEIHLQRGETRAARDLVERALLVAADYRVALDLQRALQGAAP